MPPGGDLPIVGFESSEAWREWLTEHHASSQGVWLKVPKKVAAGKSVSYVDALEEAMCYGWIDSQKRPFDGEYSLQRFTPRGPRSKWSRINTERAEALAAAGRMQPAGLREMEAARADGRWQTAYPSQRAAEVPDDLAVALERNPGAKAFFEQLESYNRYAILYRLHHAAKPETRARRLEQFVGMLQRGERIHPAKR